MICISHFSAFFAVENGVETTPKNGMEFAVIYG